MGLVKWVDFFVVLWRGVSRSIGCGPCGWAGMQPRIHVCIHPYIHIHHRTHFATPRLPGQLDPRCSVSERGTGYAHAHAQVDEPDAAAGVAHEVFEGYVPVVFLFVRRLVGFMRAHRLYINRPKATTPATVSSIYNKYIRSGARCGASAYRMYMYTYNIYVPVSDAVRALHVEEAQGDLPHDGGGLGLADAAAIRLHLCCVLFFSVEF